MFSYNVFIYLHFGKYFFLLVCMINCIINHEFSQPILANVVAEVNFLGRLYQVIRDKWWLHQIQGLASISGLLEMPRKPKKGCTKKAWCARANFLVSFPCKRSTLSSHWWQSFLLYFLIILFVIVLISSNMLCVYLNYSNSTSGLKNCQPAISRFF